MRYGRVAAIAGGGIEFGEGGADLLIGLKTENALDFAPDKIALFVGELAGRIKTFELGRVRTGGKLALLLEVDDFASEAGEDVEEAGVFKRIFGEFLLEG